DATAELHAAGSWRMSGDVRWAHAGDVRLVMRKGEAELDLRGIPIEGGLVLAGGGSWSMTSDLVLAGIRPVVLKQGVLSTNGNLLQAPAMQVEGRAAKHLRTGSSVVMLSEA